MSTRRRARLNETASAGFTSSAGTYVRGRPTYAPDAIARLVRHLIDSPQPVADIGAGTGVMSEQLRERGISVIAVDPVINMLEKAPFPCRPLCATADSLPFGDASLKGVVAAQSFHWFANTTSLVEFHRVLGRDGVLALVWNERDARTDWVASYDAVVDRFAGETPRFSTFAWQQCLQESNHFEAGEYFECANPSVSSKAGVIARAMSTSFIAMLDDEQRASIERELDRVVAPLPEEFLFPYLTRVWIYRPIANLRSVR
jgi:SAM-dependent methyltransferase